MITDLECKRCTGVEHTIIVPEDQPVQSVETEKVEEIPRERRDPSYIHIWGLDPSLQHRLESQCQGERQLDYVERTWLVHVYIPIRGSLARLGILISERGDNVFVDVLHRIPGRVGTKIPDA